MCLVDRYFLMPYPIPSLDNTNTASWTPHDIAAYNKQDFYYVKKDIATRKSWESWKPLFASVPFKQGSGMTKRIVNVVQSPIMRQLAFPVALNQMPTIDVFAVKEHIEDSTPFWHDFQTPHFGFLPSYVDFLRGNVEPNRQNLQKQVMAYEEQAIRSFVLQRSPYVWVAGYGMVAAPIGTMNAALNAANSKNSSWFIQQFDRCTKSLTLSELGNLLSEATDTIGATPFEGSGLQRAKSQALDERYVLLTENMTWNAFGTDPWVTQNRPLNMNIVTDGFRGDLFGQVRTKFEKFPLHFKLTDSSSTGFTLPAPETTATDSNLGMLNDTIPTPDFANSEIMISWFMGGPGYETIDTGAPSAEFAKGIPAGFKEMKWNGEVYMTKDFLVQVGVNGSGNPIYDTNSKGRWLRMEATLSGGVSALQAKNCIPIIHRRAKPSYAGV